VRSVTWSDNGEKERVACSLSMTDRPLIQAEYWIASDALRFPEILRGIRRVKTASMTDRGEWHPGYSFYYRIVSEFEAEIIGVSDDGYGPEPDDES